MECADTLTLIASYLTKKELVILSGVSPLCRKIVTDSFISYEEKQYLVWPCLKEDHVELAPPSQILALGYLEKEQRLLVLVRSGTDTSSIDEVECYLYTRLVGDNGCLVDHQKELPACFAFPSSLVRFSGNRYLLCTTREGELHVFDALTEVMIELPVGTDGFYASPNGDRFLLDYDHHAFFCTANVHVSFWWEMSRLDPKRHSSAYSEASDLQQSALLATHLRARIVPLPDPFQNFVTGIRSRDTVLVDASHLSPPLRFYLGASSAAWRAFWMGGASALYANEDGVFLLKTSALGKVVAEELFWISSWCLDLVHSSCGDVYSTPCEDHDEYAVMNCREVRLHTVNYQPKRQDTEERFIDLAAIIPNRVAFKSVRIAVCQATYLVYMQHQGLDRVLLLSSDLSLTRWILIGHPSCYVLRRQQVSLVTASLSYGDCGDNLRPLMETVEGGLGCVYMFGLRPPELSPTAPPDPFMTVLKVTSAVGGDIVFPATGRFLMMPPSFTGVEVLSCTAFGIVSASLLWTVSVLCYNGWWLHLQSLLWGTVS